MPRIRIQQQQFVSGGIGQVQGDTSAGVNAARELERLGQQMQDQGFNTMERIKRAEESSEVAAKQRQTLQDYDKWSAEDEQKNGHVGKSERTSKWFDDRRNNEDASNNFSSKRAENQYNQRIAPTITKSLLDVQLRERQKRIEDLDIARDEETGSYAKRQIEAPDAQQLILDEQTYDATLQTQVEAGALNVDDVSKERKANLQKMSVSMFQGLLQKDDYDTADKYLHGKDPSFGNKFKDSLSPEQFKSISGAINQKRKESNQTTLAEQRRTVNDIVADLKMGNSADNSELDRLSKAMAANPESKKDDVARMQNEIRAAKVLNTYMSQAKMASPSELVKLSAGFESQVRGKDKTFGAADEFEMMRAFQSTVSTMQKQKNADPLAYVAQNDEKTRKLLASPNLAEREIGIDHAIGLQKRIGVHPANIRVSSPNETSLFAQNLEVAKTPSQLEFMISNAQEKYGKHSKQFFSELSGDKNGVGNLAVIGMMSNRDARLTVAESLIDKKAIDEDFKTNPELKSMDKEIKTQASLATDKFMNSFVSAANGRTAHQTAQSFKEAIIAQSRKMYSRGKFNGTEEEAVEQASRIVFDSNFATAESGHSTAVIPKNSQGLPDADPEVVDRFMSESMKGQWLKTLNPYGELPIEMKQRNLPEDQAKESLINRIVSQGRWATNASMDGVVLMYEGKDGPQPITKIEGGERKLVEFKYSDMQSWLLYRESEIKQRKEDLGRARLKQRGL